MAFSERLKKVKKAAVMAGLAVAGVAAPIKAQTAEAMPEKATVTATAKHTDTQKKKQFEAAVRAGAPKEEIVKYMDFPGFMPVTKDGQFDEKKASDWAEKLAPYMKVLAEKGKTMSAADAYKAFKETTGQKDVSLEDFEQVCKLTQEAAHQYGNKWINIALGSIVGFVAAAFALGTGSMAFGIGKEIVRDLRRHRADLIASGDIIGLTFFAGLTAAATFGSYASIERGLISGLLSTPEREIRSAYSRTYDYYVGKTIDTQKKQLQQMEWDQVKQALSPQK